MYSKTRRTFTLLTTVALTSALFLSVSPAGAKKKDRLRYHLTAQGQGHVGLAAGRASRLILTISSWSTEEEIAKIREIIAGQNTKEIRKALAKAREVGRLQVPGQSGIDLIYAQRIEEHGKTVVPWAADRPWGSVPNISTNTEVRFLIAFSVMELDAEGKGTGVISPAIQPALGDNGRLKIEHSMADPIKLTNVALQK